MTPFQGWLAFLGWGFPPPVINPDTIHITMHLQRTHTTPMSICNTVTKPAGIRRTVIERSER